MAEQDQLRARRDGLLKAAVQVVHGGRRHGEGDGFEHDAFAALALGEGGEHARIVLVGGEDLVAALEIDAVLRVLQGFAGVARDGDLLGIAARGLGQAAADRFHLAFEHADHGVIRPHVGVLQVAAHGVLHGARRGADVAVVEVDDIAVDAERGADLAPEVFVGGDLFRGAGSGGAGGGAHAVDGMALQHYGGGEAQ